MTLVKRLLDWKALGVHPDICLEAATEIQRMQTRTMELERDNAHLRAEIEVLQRMRHREIVT